MLNQFYSQFSIHHDDHDNTELIDISLCGFHVLDGAFQTGNRVVGGKLNDTLRLCIDYIKGAPLDIN